MVDTQWTLHGREFANCNCAYGCPCQFMSLPTHGDCKAVLAVQIDKGRHGATDLDGLRVAQILRWPGPIHLGDGQVQSFVDVRASAAQRDALVRILNGLDTVPGSTHFNVFASTMSKVHDPVFADIDFSVDVPARRAQLKVKDFIELRGEPIINPVSGQEFRGRIDLPNGFEFTEAEMGRGWSKTSGPIALELADSHGHFAELHLSQDGVVRG